jgi:hypothetical protein
MTLTEQIRFISDQAAMHLSAATACEKAPSGLRWAHLATEYREEAASLLCIEITPRELAVRERAWQD